MQRAKRMCTVAISMTLAAAGTAAAQQSPAQQQPQQQQQQEPQPPAAEPVEVMAEKVSAVATVDKVDIKNRELMLRDDRGSQFQVKVPAEVPNLDMIKKGDKVAVDYYTTMALSLVKSPKGKPGAAATQVIERIPGPLPTGVVANKISATVEVVKVDKAANKVTIKNPAGKLDTIQVTDPAMQADLAKLKPGDKIHANYTEAVAIAVAPQTHTPKQG